MPRTPEDLLNELRSRRQSEEVEQQEHHPLAGQSLAVRALSDVIAGLAVGIGVGYYLDIWLETSPILLTICTLLGAAAGVISAIRLGNTFEEAQSEKRKTPIDKND
jgi:ATP synthase protein I